MAGWVAMTISGTALALSEPRPRFRLIYPADGSQHIPVNTLIWVGDVYGPQWKELALIDASGQAVPAMDGKLSAGLYENIFTLRPTVPLAADAQYRIKVGDEVLSTFQTGSARDDVAPAQPALAVVTATQYTGRDMDSCEPVTPCVSAVVGVEGPPDAIAVMARSDSTAIDLADEPVAAVTGCICRGCVATGSDAELSFHYCWDPSQSALQRFEVHLGAIDFAGNFSGWTRPLEVDLREEQNAGCSTARGAGSVALMALFAVLVRRRQPAR